MQASSFLTPTNLRAWICLPSPKCYILSSWCSRPMCFKAKGWHRPKCWTHKKYQNTVNTGRCRCILSTCCTREQLLNNKHEQILQRPVYKVQKKHINNKFWRATLPKFNSSPLKSYPNPIGNNCLPTIHFQGLWLLVSGRVTSKKNPPLAAGTSSALLHVWLLVKYSAPERRGQPRPFTPNKLPRPKLSLGDSGWAWWGVGISGA